MRTHLRTQRHAGSSSGQRRYYQQKTRREREPHFQIARRQSSGSTNCRGSLPQRAFPRTDCIRKGKNDQSTNRSGRQGAPACVGRCLLGCPQQQGIPFRSLNYVRRLLYLNFASSPSLRCYMILHSLSLRPPNFVGFAGPYHFASHHFVFFFAPLLLRVFAFKFIRLRLCRAVALRLNSFWLRLHCAGSLRSLFLCLLCLGYSPVLMAVSASSTNYSSVDSIFARHCLDCHASTDPEGQLVLESFDSLMKGGELGAAIVPGKSVGSLLVQMIEGRFEKEGKKKIMPPGKREKLNPTEIATIKAWIDAGAPPPLAPIAKTLTVPKIEPKVIPRKPVNALAWSPAANLVGIARYAEVELRLPSDLRVVRTLSGHAGNINTI